MIATHDYCSENRSRKSALCFTGKIASSFQLFIKLSIINFQVTTMADCFVSTSARVAVFVTKTFSCIFLWQLEFSRRANAPHQSWFYTNVVNNYIFRAFNDRINW